MLRLPLALLGATLLLACAASTSGPNPTVFPYQLDSELLERTRIERVIIASVNLSGITRSYLKEAEPRVDRAVADYLEEHGFAVVSQRRFQQEWKTAVRVHGEPFDPTTGRVNGRALALALASVCDSLRESDRVDAIVFTDIVERDIVFGGGLKHLARWDGVTRKPGLQGPGDGVSANFDWNQSAKGASLLVSIYSTELQRAEHSIKLQRVHRSMGGLDATEAIDTRSATGDFARRRDILENDDHIREGVELAFYPFIEMRDYPGPAE